MLLPYRSRAVSAPLSRLLAVMLPAALVLACSDSPSAPPPVPSLPPLPSGTWYVNEADGQALPAMIAHRLVNGVLEQTFLDSSSFQIDPAGTWQQLIFKRRVLIGTPAATGTAATGHATTGEATNGDIYEPVVDFGTWTATDSAYLFSSLARARQFVIRAPSTDSLSTYQKLVDHAESGVVRSSFRRTPPTQSIVGVWRADRAQGATLPSLVESIPAISIDGRVISWHLFLDSARVELRSDGKYEHRTYVSTWEGAENGPPLTRIGTSKLTDRGVWGRTGLSVSLASEWYENHTLNASIAASGAFVVNHGVDINDPNPFPVTYKRQ